MARKVLLADDSVTAQNMGRKILADAGYEVITVNNGSAALKKIAEAKPDLVVLDIYMPGYSGLEVCQRLKESADTADLPVLLTVGKLEPFKPEEAQRVHADAFIVKPFEASELLTTLSKLEDKVVPRSEGAKTGRFARAVSKPETSGKNDRKEGSESTWRDRIKFPTIKKETVEQSPDDGALYNPVNRDLRTVVERPTSPPTGIPADATAEEMAALAAAMSKLSGGESAPTVPPQDVPAENAEAVASPSADVVAESAMRPEAVEPATPVAESAIPSVKVVEASAAVETENETRPEAIVESNIVESNIAESRDDVPAELPTEKDVQAAIASLSPVCSETKSTADVPVTIAAAYEQQISNEPRWTAVAVAPSPEEADLSLEREMQKAFAAFAAAGAATVAVAATFQPPPPVTAINEPAMAAASQTLAERVSEVVSTPPDPCIEAAQTSESQPQESPISETHEVVAVAAQEAAPELVPAAAPITAEVAQNAQPVADLQAPDLPAATEQTVQKDQDESHHSESHQPVSQKEEAALAVAAGAERLIEAAKAAAPEADPNSIASIVESVMAELRPKLVEEITRKLASEKK